MDNIQHSNQAIHVDNWRRDEQFAQYPEGARDKTLLYCPNEPPYIFLKSNYRYLFKRSSPRYPEQFWAEIIASRLGVYMDIHVPPAFVAFDEKEKQSGIEWFLSPGGYIFNETFTPGGDYCQQFIPNFERKKGKQHNFETITKIFQSLSQIYSERLKTDWKNYWAKTFLFDALIGNTDRHQDNWGTIVRYNIHKQTSNIEEMRIAPVFDNGTSMGHEIFSNNFSNFESNNGFEKYISKGLHHIKWELKDFSRIGHSEMVEKFSNTYPETRTLMLDSLKKVNLEIFKNILDVLVDFDIPIKLTKDRANFMLKLLSFRHQRLLNILEK